MIVIARGLGSIEHFPLEGRALERVPVGCDDLARRVLRLASSVGEIGVRLEGSDRLRDGEVVYADDRTVVCIEVAPEDVLAARPQDIDAALHLAHALGNRHLPALIADGEIVVRYDPLIEALMREAAVPFVREQRRLARPFLHAHAPHTHESENS